jgi:hypothetical protein
VVFLFGVATANNYDFKKLADRATPRGVAQCHLVTTVDQVQIVDRTSENVGPVTLAQIREVVAVLIGL